MTDADWIEWNGGTCHVEPETIVDVKTYDGITINVRAYYFQSIDGGPDNDW